MSVSHVWLLCGHKLRAEHEAAAETSCCLRKRVGDESPMPAMFVTLQHSTATEAPMSNNLQQVVQQAVELAVQHAMQPIHQQLDVINQRLDVIDQGLREVRVTSYQVGLTSSCVVNLLTQ